MVWKGFFYHEKNYLNSNLFDQNTPVVFTDGSSVFNELQEQYITHKKGFFIYDPSGVGKSYFVRHQKENHWIDGDYLWEVCHAFPKGLVEFKW